MRKFALLAALPLLFTLYARSAQDPPAKKNVFLKGYLNIRYTYVGSALAATSYSGLRLTGSFQLSALSDKIILKYRSHHWVNFERPANSVLESPFENRHIIQTISLETKNLLAPGLRFKIGRIFPEMDYASTPLVDGAWIGWESGGFSVLGSAGRLVDFWNGKQDGQDLAAAFGLKYRSPRFTAAAGFSRASYSGLRMKEIPAGLNVLIGKDIWLEAYGGYDLEDRNLARAGFSFSWRADSLNLSVTASQWRNPFDQLYLVDKTKNLAYWGLYSKEVPATYQDIRIAAFYSRGGWGFRGSVGAMSGVRSGWLGSANVMTPEVFGFRLNFGGQAMKSDFIEFYSLDVRVTTQVRDLSLDLQSQTRYYQWLPRPSGFHNMDNYSELTAEYPLQRHFFLSAAAGGFFRRLGDESFKPQVELRIIVRI